MRKLPILKTFTSILFVIAMVGIIFAIPLMVIAAVMPESIPADMKFTVSGRHATEFLAEDFIMIAALLAAYGFWVYALYLFKQVLGLFEKKRLFDDAVIKNFDQCGKAIIVGYSIYAIAYFLYNTLVVNKLKLSSDFVVETLFIGGLGLFFIVMGEVLLIAKNMKEENDLTV